MWLSLSVATTVLVFSSNVEVRSNSTCPSDEAITARLVPLLSGGVEQAVAYVDVGAESTGEATEIHLRLLRPEGSVVGDRRLGLRGGCDAMADTVATVLATWMAPPVATARTPIAASYGEAAHDNPSVRVQTWVGAGGGAAMVGTLAGNGQLDLVIARPTSHMRARVAALTQTARQLAFEGHDVTWRRTHAELGLGWQSHGAADGSFWQAAADLDGLLGWLTASGQGFFQDHRQDAFEYGVGLGARLERKLGAWALWVEARGNLWAQRQRAVLSGSTSSAELPRVDVLVTLGVSRRAFP